MFVRYERSSKNYGQPFQEAHSASSCSKSLHYRQNIFSQPGGFGLTPQKLGGRVDLRRHRRGEEQLDELLWGCPEKL